MNAAWEQAKRVRTAAVLTGGAVLLCVVAGLALLDITEQHEVGLSYSLLSAEVTKKTPGIHLSAPWTLVAQVDTRPQKVCVSTTAKVLACKLVQFEPAHFQEFVRREGFRYYWLSNRLSFNWGYTDEHRGMRDVLRGYAFDAQKHSFVTVLEP